MSDDLLIEAYKQVTAGQKPAVTLLNESPNTKAIIQKLAHGQQKGILDHNDLFVTSIALQVAERVAQQGHKYPELVKAFGTDWIQQFQHGAIVKAPALNDPPVRSGVKV